MTDADKRINSLHFGSDPADIRIQINPELWIRIRNYGFESGIPDSNPNHFGDGLRSLGTQSIRSCILYWQLQ